MLAHSEPCERNKNVIVEQLIEVFAQSSDILEIGTGTAQHAVYFGERLPHLNWQCSDLPENMAMINARLALEGGPNVLAPIALDVAKQPWSIEKVDGIFTANTLHIISWQHVVALFTGLATVLRENGKLCVYGPFKYQGRYTSESNANFDEWLKEQDRLSGIRDFEAVHELAEKANLRLMIDKCMPANNQLIVWQKSL